VNLPQRARRTASRARRVLLSSVLERSGETSGAVRLADVGLEHDGYHDYEPSGWRSLHRALQGLGVGPDDVFVDIGCGKGRVVAQAVRRPFRRVIGVDLSPELVAQARVLVEHTGRSRCGEVEVVIGDATRWQVPDDATIVYVYNALSGDSLRAMLDRVAESEQRAPRRLLFLYVNPLSEADVLAHPRFTLLERRAGRRWSATDPRRVSVFRVGA
jgi:SAM-dependent methyltransferase